jgi:hypothetical protein
LFARVKALAGFADRRNVNPRYRIYAAVGLAGVVLLGGGFMLLGRGSSAPAAAPVIKPLHPVNKAKNRAARPASSPKTAVRARSKKAAKAKPALKAKTALAPPAVRKTNSATDGMPAALSAALKSHAVVVVSLVVPGATVDNLAYQEAKAGAARAGAGFVRIDASDNADVQALSTLIDSSSNATDRLLDAPAVLIFRRPQELYVRIDGYLDADTVAQAAENAAPVSVLPGKGELASAWVRGANAACTELRSAVVNASFPTSDSQVVPFVRQLLGDVKATVDKIRALKPPAGEQARVRAMLADYDNLLAAVSSELDAAQKNQLIKVQQLAAQATKYGQAGDAIAAQLGATACSQTGA